MNERNGLYTHAVIREGLECWDVIDWLCGVPVSREATYLSEGGAQQLVARRTRGPQ